VPGPLLEPLQPDRLAEDYVAHLVEEDPAALTLAEDLLAPPAGSVAADAAGASQLAAALTTLVEAAHRHPHLAHRLVLPAIASEPRRALTLSGTTLARLADVPGMDEPLLSAVESVLPSERNLELESGSAAITLALVRCTDPGTTDPATLTERHDTLSRRLSHAGRYEEALEHAQEAVKGYRRLAQITPAYRGALASALDSLGQRLAERSRHDEAMTPQREAVLLFRELAAAEPDVYRPLLAASLHNFDMLLGDFGSHEDALGFAQEAVMLARGLTGAGCDESLLLAGALNTLAGHLGRLGRHAEALDAAEEGVAIGRRLVEPDPNRRPLLASMLLTLGLSYRALKRHEEAVVIGQEAVDLARSLNSVTPVVSGTLAGALHNFGLYLRDVGRLEEALTASQEAAGLFRQLGESDMKAYYPVLGSFLLSSQLLRDLGRQEDAILADERSIELYRRLAEGNPRAYGFDLTCALNSLASELAHAGRRTEALALSREGVEVCGRLAQADRTCLPLKAMALGDFAVMRVKVNRELRSALKAVTEAISILSRHPGAFARQLGQAYWLQVTLLEQLGRRAEAAALRRQLTTAISDG